MSTIFSDPAIREALWIAVKASMLLGAAAAVQAALRQASAATRHLLWTLAILAVLLLPVLALVLPAWGLPIVMSPAPVAEVARPPDSVDGRPDAPGAIAAPATNAEPAAPAPRQSGVSWPALIAGVYLAGVIVMLLRLATERRNVRRLAGAAADVNDLEWTRLAADCAGRMGVRQPVRLLRSREATVPMTFGTADPFILIPAVADAWAEDRRRAVILHEMAHIARRDCLTQTMAFAACTMYWFHPAVWWAARRLRVERELACDDRVIAAGAPPREYAGHLLEIAYSFAGHRAPALVVSMARQGHLEGRMIAALDSRRNRSVPAHRARLAVSVAAIVLVIALAGVRATRATGDSAPQSTPAAAAAEPARQPAVVGRHLQSVGESTRPLVRAAAALAGFVQGQLPGTWEIRPTKTTGAVHLRLTEANSSSGTTMAIDRFEGLTAAQLAGPGGPVQFRLRRDAGTFTFEGVLRNGVGAGTFSFTPDPRFPDELAKRGFTRPTATEQYQMARHDIGYAFVEELSKQGYSKPQTSDLVRAGEHGVEVTYLREMGALGYRLGSLEPLITLRDHGVAPAYIRELADLGYKGLSADELRRARDHGVSAEYVRAMRDAGYSSLSMEQLRNARDHGVTAQFVKELGDAGHRKLPLDQLIRVRDHGVTPDYLREMRQLGHAPAIDELVRARDHGVDVEFVRSLAALGYDKLPLDSLIRLRDHGVTPEYAQQIKALGYDGLTPDDLVTLRDHGLTPDRIRAANARAGTRLPIDMLKSFAAGGLR
jgi:beta-lactamase regulating signal transducer with metallopeptidase domain